VRQFELVQLVSVIFVHFFQGEKQFSLYITSEIFERSWHFFSGLILLALAWQDTQLVLRSENIVGF